MENLIYEEYIPVSIRKTFTDQVRAISSRLKIKPDWLMRVMYSESRLNPQARNNNTGGSEPAVGLIQWLTYSAQYVGTTVWNLLQMNHLQQLVYVEKYFQPFAGKMKSAADVYLVCFYPLALGKSDDWVIGSEKGASYSQLVASLNTGFNTNRDRAITVGEFRNSLKYLPAFQHIEEEAGKGFNLPVMIGLGILAGAGFVYFSQTSEKKEERKGLKRHRNKYSYGKNTYESNE